MQSHDAAVRVDRDRNNGRTPATPAAAAAAADDRPRVHLVKGARPLQRYRFYLDVRNHAVNGKLEARIKQFGGVVEYFLVKEVTHVVSDRATDAGHANSPAANGTLSNESGPANGSPRVAHHSNAGTTRQRTRADAMLEKVRVQPATAVRDPLHEAQLWHIPVWSVSKVSSWLEKVGVSLAASSRRCNANLLSIQAPFLKLEPLARDCRPIFRSLSVWPTLDLEGPPGKGAFQTKAQTAPAASPATNETMTRKGRPRLSVRKEPEDKVLPYSGYCEICHVEYQNLGEHVRSDTHLGFVRDDANFLTLDSLIGAGANVEAFLRLNGATKDCVLGRRTPRRNGRPVLNGSDEYVPRRTGRRRTPRVLSSPPSPAAATATDTHNLRPRRSGCEDEPPAARRSCPAVECARPRRSCIRGKRMSADERLVTDNKTYYKVEVMTNKLRSSGLGGKEQELPQRVETHTEDADEGSLVVKFKRIRRSELSVLNDEAENFMFPRKGDSDDSDLDTDEAPDTTRSSVRPYSSDIKSEPLDSADDSPTETRIPACDVESAVHRRKRRASDDEVDSVPASRPRHASPAAVKLEDETAAAGNKPTLSLNELTFSFEFPPKSEPWYTTFTRQDCADEFYTSFSDSGYVKPMVLPYQLAYIPPLDPQVCWREYVRAKEQLTRARSTSPEGTSAAGTPVFDQLDESCSSAPMTPGPAATDTSADEPMRKRKKHRPRQPNLQRNPRKSPRQHASTLAILSSLIQQRKKRERKHADMDSSKLTSIPEETEDEALDATMADEDTAPDDDRLFDLYRAVDEILSVPIDESDFAGMSVSDGVYLRERPDAIAVLETYRSEGCSTRRTVERTTRRKRKKKNRTGWPKKKRLLVRRDPKSEDGSTTPARERDLHRDTEREPEPLPDQDSDPARERDGDGDVTAPAELGKLKCVDEVTNASEVNGDVDAGPRTDVNENERHARYLDNCVSNDSNEENKFQAPVDGDRAPSAGAHVLAALNAVRTVARHPSLDCVEEVVAAAAGAERLSECVNVDLDKWESAEKFLHANMAGAAGHGDRLLQYQPFVKVQKMEALGLLGSRRLRSASAQGRRGRRTRPPAGSSPRKLRAPRAKWYRER